MKVSTRFLPQRLVLDAGDDVGGVNEVLEEAVPGLDRSPRPSGMSRIRAVRQDGAMRHVSFALQEGFGYL